MSPEKQRIAIAKACGLEVVSDGITHCLTPCILGTGKLDPNGKGLTYVPDYLNDLNAMHEAEWKMLKGTEQLTCYEDILKDIINRDGTDCIRGVFRAKAAQRAEAFLRTLGLWEEAA